MEKYCDEVNPIFGDAEMRNKDCRVLILDMQPIDPPIGGGRLRILGLYHNLGENIEALYIGTYDWPGEKFRDHKLSETLREVNIPLENEHFAECQKWQARVGGRTIIDSTFSELAHLSPKYVEYVRREVINADVVIFSHPWIFPLVKDLLKKETQLIIYDAHNVEGFLRFSLLDDGNFGTEIVRNVVKTEYELCHLADVIFACSYDDRDMFNRLYNVPFGKVKIVPNGVFTDRIYPVSNNEKIEIKKRIGLATPNIAIFIGSNYQPNLEACNFIINELAPQLPDITFVIAGGVGEAFQDNSVSNIKITGRLSDEDKFAYLCASDIAINPMLSGSGTNIKMFDFMAAGLPIISTEIGARGITTNDYSGIIVRERAVFSKSLDDIVNDKEKLKHLGRANRLLVEKNYSWERLSPRLGDYIKKKLNSKLDKHQLLTNDNSRLAIMSTWSLRCGIAEHTRRIVEEMDKKGVDYRIIANINNELISSYYIDDLTREILPLWYYDYTRWVDSKIDIRGLIDGLKRDQISNLNIQYHLGFFNQQLLLELIQACINVDIQVSLTLHNSREVNLDTLMKLVKKRIKLIVHTSEEKDFLENLNIKNVFHIPIGVINYSDVEKKKCQEELGISGYPVIGTFGFLRPHKGVLEAIESIKIIKEYYPNIKLLGINALYPSLDSEQYYQQCIERIQDLELSDNVILITSFLEVDQIIHYLHACDLILLPYHESKEGSSAAANTAIAAKRPLVISDSNIFSAIKPVSYVLKSIEPESIAMEMKTLLTKPEVLDGMKKMVISYAENNSYSTVTDKYLDVLEVNKKLDYELILQEVYESFIEPGDFAIDVGAHVGRHTIPIAKKAASNGKVFAIEPIPKCRDIMAQSINSQSSLKDIITVLPYALGNYQGSAEFTIVKNDPGYSGLRERAYERKSEIQKITVEVKTLDDQFFGLNSLKYIKIDAEGGEYDILRGGVELIKRCRPVITFEFGANSFKPYNVIPGEVFRFWKRLNYKIFDILGHELIDEKTFVKSSIDQKIWDYISIPEEDFLVTSKVLRAIMKFTQ